jgi:O-antigen ligase
MPIVIIIDLIVVGTLASVTRRKGLEQALPYFAFFVALLPQESRIRLPGALDLYSTRVALITLLVLFLTHTRKAKIRTIPLKNLIYLQVAWTLGSTLFSIVFLTSMKQLLAQVLEYYLLYYIILKTVTNTRTISKIIYAMIAAMSVCSILGLVEIYARWSVLSIFPADLQLRYGASTTLYAEMFDRGFRARATFPHPIHFGGALAMMIPLTFHLAISSESWVKKIFLNVSLLLMFWALYKTGSRGPWLATAIALSILTVAAESRVRKRMLAVAVLAGAVLILRPGIADTLWNMYRGTMDPNSMMGSSFEYRSILLHTVTKTLNENPARAILGFGLGSFREKGLVLEVPGIETRRWYTCDSTWVLFAYETGYVGFLLLGAILLKPAALALRSFRNLPKSNRHFCLVFFSSLAAFYVVMISVAIYGWGQNGYMLWTVIALSFAYPILKKDELRRRAVLLSAQRLETTAPRRLVVSSGRALDLGD